MFISLEENPLRASHHTKWIWVDFSNICFKTAEKLK